MLEGGGLSALATLPHLHTLRLQHDERVSTLGTLRTLWWLDVSGCHALPEVPAELQAAARRAGAAKLC